jgi:hypothetical protein
MMFLLIFIALFTHQTDPVTGTWKGTSICQVKTSPCHNENVVYHISKKAENSYEILANKIVNGAEEEMGILSFTWDPLAHTLVCDDKERKAVWTFILHENTMEGKLVSRDQLFRIIHVSKTNDKP